jgi:hypothetical protein
MRKIIVLLGIFFLFYSIAWAQEKVETPVWKVGDKWVFTQGNIEVIGIDQDSYTLNFSKETCRVENKGLEKIIFDKSTLNRIYAIKEDNREKYTLPHRKLLNFPLNLGKEWKDTSTTTASVGPTKGVTMDFSEAYKVLGWENVKVQAGHFKTIKLEYIQETPNRFSGKAIYWYAPEAKYFVKCQYDKIFWKEVNDWELISFKLKK